MSLKPENKLEMNLNNFEWISGLRGKSFVETQDVFDQNDNARLQKRLRTAEGGSIPTEPEKVSKGLKARKKQARRLELCQIQAEIDLRDRHK
jgi:hypothetical protein